MKQMLVCAAAPAIVGLTFSGAGIGVGRVQPDRGQFSGDDTELAYQLQGGASYPIADRWAAQLIYRYRSVNGVKIGPDAGKLHGDDHDQAVTVGASYAFGG